MAFYNCKTNINDDISGLFKASIIPRPIAWISTKSPEGIINLAPYSYFNAIQDKPPIIMFSSSAKNREGDIKDSLRNIITSRQFVINMVSKALFEKMKITSEDLEYNHSEVELAGIELSESKIINVPKVKDSPINLECQLAEIIELPENIRKKGYKIVFGEVLGIHINDGLIKDNKILIDKTEIVARLGYKGYTSILSDNIFD